MRIVRNIHSFTLYLFAEHSTKLDFQNPVMTKKQTNNIFFDAKPDDNHVLFQRCLDDTHKETSCVILADCSLVVFSSSIQLISFYSFYMPNETKIILCSNKILILFCHNSHSFSLSPLPCLSHLTHLLCQLTTCARLSICSVSAEERKWGKDQFELTLEFCFLWISQAETHFINIMNNITILKKPIYMLTQVIKTL